MPQVFANYLLQRVADKEAPFQLRLHLIYLINDVLHHCQRKNVEGRPRFESFDVCNAPIFIYY